MEECLHTSHTLTCRRHCFYHNWCPILADLLQPQTSISLGIPRDLLSLNLQNNIPGNEPASVTVNPIGSDVPEAAELPVVGAPLYRHRQVVMEGRGHRLSDLLRPVTFMKLLGRPQALRRGQLCVFDHDKILFQLSGILLDSRDLFTESRVVFVSV